MEGLEGLGVLEGLKEVEGGEEGLEVCGNTVEPGREEKVRSEFDGLLFSAGG